MNDTFQMIREWLRSGAKSEVDSTGFSSPEIRVIHVARQFVSVAGAGSADLVSAVRHVLRTEQQRQGGIEQSVFVPKNDPWPRQSDWELASLQVDEFPAHFRLEPRPWKPTWL